MKIIIRIEITTSPFGASPSPQIRFVPQWVKSHQITEELNLYSAMSHPRDDKKGRACEGRTNDRHNCPACNAGLNCAIQGSDLIESLFARCVP